MTCTFCAQATVTRVLDGPVCLDHAEAWYRELVQAGANRSRELVTSVPAALLVAHQPVKRGRGAPALFRGREGLIRQMRERFASRTWTVVDLARFYGCSISGMTRILHGLSYPHAGGPIVPVGGYQRPRGRQQSRSLRVVPLQRQQEVA